MPDRDVVLIGRFEANHDTKYKVEHYTETLNGNERFELKTTDNLTGTTDSKVTAEAKEFEGFTLDKTIEGTIESGIVAGDGSLVLKLFYTRNSHTVTYEYRGDVKPEGSEKLLPSGGTYSYEEEVTIADPIDIAGYTFAGWDFIQHDVTVNNNTFNMPDRDVVLIGRFEANHDTKYKVEHYTETLNGNERFELKTTDNLTGTTDSKVTAEAKEFEGFTLDKTIEGTIESGIVAGDGSLVLKLFYTRNSHTVTYEYRGDVKPEGSEKLLPSGGTYSYEEEVTIADPIDIAGYTFAGWDFIQHDVTVNNNTFNMPDRDVVLIGRFTRNSNTKYKVEHYTETLNGTTRFELRDTQNLTGTTDSKVTAEAKDFEGFTFDNTIEGTIESGIVAGDGSLVLKLFYTRNSHTVTYEYRGDVKPEGSEKLLPSGGTYSYEEEVTIADPIDIAGYTFAGWDFIQHDVTVNNNTFNMPDRDVVLIGRFTRNSNTKYKVEHYTETLNGTTRFELRDTQNLTGTTDSKVTAEAKDFEGFTFDNTIEGTIESGIVAGDGSLVLKLFYTRNSHTVTYEYRGDVKPEGSEKLLPSGGTYSYEEEVTIADPIDIAGYTFAGWDFIQHDVTVNNNTFNMPDRDVVLIGRFTRNSNTEYKVEHYIQNLDLSSYSLKESKKLTGTTDSKVVAYPNEYNGFTFDNTIDGTIESGIVAGDGSLVLKLFYIRNKYNVKYEFEGNIIPKEAIVPSPEEHLYEEEVNIANDIIIPGYIFDGWHTSDNDSLKVANTDTIFTMPSSDVKLYGSFIPYDDVNYEIHHYLQKLDGTYNNPSSENGTLEIKEDGVTGEIVKATVKEFEGYTFENNNSNNIMEGIVNVDKNGNGTLVLKLYYERNKHKVHYSYYSDNDNNYVIPAGASELPEEKEYKFEEIVTVEQPGFIDGYTFIGWSTLNNSTLTIDNNQFEMPNREVYLRGTFKANTNTQYKVEFYYEKEGKYGDALSSIIRTGTTDTLVKVTDNDKIPNSDNYIFDDSKLEELEGTILGNGTLVLKVYFKELFKVTYVDGVNGEAFKDSSFTGIKYGEDTPLYEEEITRSGYVFTGWTPIVKDIVVENMTYTATWKQCTPVIADPPVKKQIIGDEPHEDGTFIFTLTAESNTASLETMPMPDGSNGNIKKVSIVGAGEYEFGNITFTVPGTYIYKIVEDNENDLNYDYDNSTYTVTYVVTQNGDKLEVERTITKDGKEADDVVFVNTYYNYGAGGDEPIVEPEPQTNNPQTGDSIALYIVILINSVLGIIGTSYVLKKEYYK